MCKQSLVKHELVRGDGKESGTPLCLIMHVVPSNHLSRTYCTNLDKFASSIQELLLRLAGVRIPEPILFALNLVVRGAARLC